MKPPKQFHTIEGADHNDTWVVGGEAYFDTLKRFALTSLPPIMESR